MLLKYQEFAGDENRLENLNLYFGSCIYSTNESNKRTLINHLCVSQDAFEFVSQINFYIHTFMWKALHFLFVLVVQFTQFCQSLRCVPVTLRRTSLCCRCFLSRVVATAKNGGKIYEDAKLSIPVQTEYNIHHTDLL